MFEGLSEWPKYHWNKAEPEYEPESSDMDETKDEPESECPCCFSRITADIDTWDCEICGRRICDNCLDRKTETFPRIHVCSECAEEIDKENKEYEAKEDKKSDTKQTRVKRKAEDQRMQNSKRFKCSQCDMQTDYKCALKTHEAEIHGGHRDFVCHTCGKAFKRKGHLSQHEKYHNQDRQFVCDNNGCAKSFVRLWDLKTHQRIHAGDLRYACAFEGCDKRFAQASAKHRHEKTHADIRDFECRFCGKWFTTKQSLEIHILTHSGERPFPCDVCEYRARQLVALHKHKKAMHTTEGQQRQKKKENRFFKALEQADEKIDQREFVIDMSCVGDTFARADGVLYTEKVVWILELCENQHKWHASVACDPSRASKIYAALIAGGETRPIVIINFNPDSFSIDGKKAPKSIKYQDRIDCLIRFIHNPDNFPTKPLSLVYFFYDVVKRFPKILSDPEYPKEMKPCVRCVYLRGGG